MLGNPEDVSSAFMAAWNRHDMPALAGVFTSDAQFVNVVGLWWKSRAEIEAGHAAVHQTIFARSRLEGSVSAVTDIRNNVKALHVMWELSGLFAPDGTPAPSRRGVLVMIVVAEDGGWLCKVAQNTDIIEGVVAPPPRPR